MCLLSLEKALLLPHQEADNQPGEYFIADPVERNAEAPAGAAWEHTWDGALCRGLKMQHPERL